MTGANFSNLDRSQRHELTSPIIVGLPDSRAGRRCWRRPAGQFKEPGRAPARGRRARRTARRNMSSVLETRPADAAFDSTGQKAHGAGDATDAPATTDGFHLVIDALKLNGIDTIFGVPGIPITDLTRLAQAEGLRMISFRHEQHAGNAAAAAGYLEGKPGICLTVSAPGFLNGLT